MDDRQKLKKLLEEKLIPELDHFLSQLEMIKHSGAASEEDAQVGEETRVLHQTFKELLDDIQTGKMGDNEAHEIIKELKKYQG